MYVYFRSWVESCYMLMSFYGNLETGTISLQKMMILKLATSALAMNGKSILHTTLMYILSMLHAM